MMTVTKQVKLGIYDQSRLLAVIEATPQVAWRAAVAYVRGMAHADGDLVPVRLRRQNTHCVRARYFSS